MAAVLSLADLGVNNGVITEVAKAYGHDDREEVKSIATAALAAMSIVAIAIIVIGVPLALTIPWGHLLAIQNPDVAKEAPPAVATFVVILALGAPAGIVSRTQAGLQESFIASAWQAVGSMVGLAAVALLVRAGAGLPQLVLALAGAPVAANVANTLVEYGIRRPDLRPSRASLQWAGVRRLAATGSRFLVLQILGVMAYSFDAAIIGRLAGLEAVSRIAVPTRLLAAATGFIGMLVAPLWAAFGEAFARNDHFWVRKALQRAVLWSLGGAAAASATACVADGPLAPYFFPTLGVMGLGVMIPLSIHAVSTAAVQPAGLLLFGIGSLRFSLYSMLIMTPVSLTAKWLLTDKFGVIGFAWAHAATYVCIITIPTLLYVSRLVGRWNGGAGAV